MKKTFNILFVCLGNICRSPMAQCLFEQKALDYGRDDEFNFDSAGTYGGHAGQLPDSRMRRHAKACGYNLNHRARKITSADFDKFDLIVAMDNDNVADLRYLAPNKKAASKVVPIGHYLPANAPVDYVPDPYYGDDRDFRLVIHLLELAASSFFAEN